MSTGLSPPATTSRSTWPSPALGSSNSPTSGGAPYQRRTAARMLGCIPDRPIRPHRDLACRAMDTHRLADLDRTVLWHPFTQQQGWTRDEDVLVIERADRCTLFDTDGNAYLDGVSSLWCNVHGHRHPHIDAAIRRQLSQVAHTTMLGLSHPPGYLRAVREITAARGIALIVDEVATGFGRTGTMFACEQEGVEPDLLCVAKGLTGGYLPLAATLASEAIYEGFLGAFSEFRTFFHGHTYTGNPLACAAAHATLDVFEEERTLEALEPKLALLGELLDEHVAPLPVVREIRRRGAMVGIELTDFPLEARMGHQVTLAARERGAIIRPLGDVIVLMPPLAMSAEELRRLVAATADAIAV